MSSVYAVVMANDDADVRRRSHIIAVCGTASKAVKVLCDYLSTLKDQTNGMLDYRCIEQEPSPNRNWAIRPHAESRMDRYRWALAGDADPWHGYHIEKWDVV